jgi:hypothetical protein
MRSKLNSLIMAAVLAVPLAGCAQVPQADVDAARKALDDAKTAQAPDYAPEAWNAANDAQAQLDTELKAQENRNALFRSYGKAKTLADQAKTEAEQAGQAAATAKEQAKTEVAALIKQAHDEYDTAQQAIASAPKGKGTEADLASMKSDATTIETTLADVQKAFDAGDYLTAKSKAEAAISSAQQIEREIENAKAQRRQS